MNTSEVLNKAADLIETRGFGHDWHAQATDTAPLCIEGALFVAVGLSHEDAHARGVDTCPGYVAMQSYLGMDADERLYSWNDQSGRFSPDDWQTSRRTAAEVIEVLRAAAVIEESREAQAIIAAASELDVRVVTA